VVSIPFFFVTEFNDYFWPSTCHSVGMYYNGMWNNKDIIPVQTSEWNKRYVNYLQG